MSGRPEAVLDGRPGVEHAGGDPKERRLFPLIRDERAPLMLEIVERLKQVCQTSQPVFVFPASGRRIVTYEDHSVREILG